ncbi:MAG: hypothetical protein RIC16_03330 [Rhodospirillales bacterium]
MSFLSQLIGAIVGAIAGYSILSMAILVVDDTPVALNLLGAGVGALLGYGIGLVIARHYEKALKDDAGTIH